MITLLIVAQAHASSEQLQRLCGSSIQSTLDSFGLPDQGC